MRTAILLLAIIGAASCMSLYQDEGVNVLCEVWRGWGQSFAGDNCSASINMSCSSIFDVIPEIIEFVKTMDWSKLGKLCEDVYLSIKGLIKQFVDCKYATYFVEFFPHFLKFITHFMDYFSKIQMDVFGLYMSIISGQFYQAGVFLGNICKTIINCE